MLPLKINFSVVECYLCHCHFAITVERDDELRRTQATFFCPEGHSQHYIGESREKRLERDMLYWKEQSVIWQCRSTAKDHRIRAMKGAVTRLRRSITRGNCPKCGKHFSDLSKHMQSHRAVKNLKRKLVNAGSNRG